MLLRDSKVVALDFETTGAVAGFPNEPWQLGLVCVDKDGVAGASSWETLFHIGERPFSPHAVGRYSEIRDRLAVSPSPMELWPELSARLIGMPLVAHNVSTERSVLSRLAPLTHFGPWIDTLRLARLAYPGMSSYALGDIVNTLGLTDRVNALCPNRSWHDALYDAVAGAVLFYHLVNLRTWENVTVEDVAC